MLSLKNFNSDGSWGPRILRLLLHLAVAAAVFSASLLLAVAAYSLLYYYIVPDVILRVPVFLDRPRGQFLDGSPCEPFPVRVLGSGVAADSARVFSGRMCGGAVLAGMSPIGRNAGHPRPARGSRADAVVGFGGSALGWDRRDFQLTSLASDMASGSSAGLPAHVPHDVIVSLTLASPMRRPCPIVEAVLLGPDATDPKGLSHVAMSRSRRLISQSNQASSAASLLFPASGIPCGEPTSLPGRLWALLFGPATGGEVHVMQGVVFGELGVGWDPESDENNGDGDHPGNRRHDHQGGDYYYGDGPDDYYYHDDDDADTDAADADHHDAGTERVAPGANDPNDNAGDATSEQGDPKPSSTSDKKNKNNNKKKAEPHRHRKRARSSAAVYRSNHAEPRPAGPLSGAPYIPTHVAVGIEGGETADIVSCEVIFVAELGLVAGVMWKWRAPAAAIGIALLFFFFLAASASLAAAVTAYRWWLSHEENAQREHERRMDARRRGRGGAARQDTTDPRATGVDLETNGGHANIVHGRHDYTNARPTGSEGDSPPPRTQFGSILAEQRSNDIAGEWGSPQQRQQPNGESGGSIRGLTPASPMATPEDNNQAGNESWEVAGPRKRNKGKKKKRG